MGSLVLIVALVSLLFFSSSGVYGMSRVGRQTLQELSVPPLKMTWRRLGQIASIAPVWPFIGVGLLVNPKWTELGMCFGIVNTLCARGDITEKQAIDYLLTKGIRWTP